MSPACNSSRPHVGVGTVVTRSSTRPISAPSIVTHTGLATAHAMSGTIPDRHLRISYRKTRNRPAHGVPTGPLAHRAAVLSATCVGDRCHLDDE